MRHPYRHIYRNPGILFYLYKRMNRLFYLGSHDRNHCHIYRVPTDKYRRMIPLDSKNLPEHWWLSKLNAIGEESYSFGTFLSVYSNIYVRVLHCKFFYHKLYTGNALPCHHRNALLYSGYSSCKFYLVSPFKLLRFRDILRVSWWPHNINPGARNGKVYECAGIHDLRNFFLNLLLTRTWYDRISISVH